MPLKISSCKKTAFRKDMTRFFPVWLGYSLVLALVLILMVDGTELDYWFHANLADSVMIMAAVNCGYGLVTAQMLFGDLFNTRLCYGLHALPLKREHWYGAHIKAGLWFSVIPTGLMTLVCLFMTQTAAGMEKGWQIPLYWFAGVNLQYLFFFGLAVFCAMCVGNRFAMAAVYAVINFGAALLMLLVDSLYTPLLFGVMTPEDPFILLCPMVQMAGSRNARLIDCTRTATDNTYFDDLGVLQKERVGSFTLNMDGWIYLAVVAALGLLLLLIARRMYRRRNLECAGDFSASPSLEPVLLVILALTGAAGLNGFVYLFFGSSLSLVMTALGLVLGWFVGLMLIKRSTRVFRLRYIPGLLVLGVLLGLSLYVTKLDPMGIETYIPETASIEKATIRANYNANLEDVKEEAVLQDLQKIHRLALEDRIPYNYTKMEEDDPEAVFFTLVYTLKNGHEMRRQYSVYADSEAGQLLKGYFSDFENMVKYDSNLENIQNAEDMIRVFDTLNYFIIDGITVPEQFHTPEFVAKLIRAVEADCKAGTMCQIREYHKEPVFRKGDASYWEFSFEFSNEDDQFFHALVYADAENTMALLEETGIPAQRREAWKSRYGG